MTDDATAVFSEVYLENYTFTICSTYSELTPSSILFLSSDEIYGNSLISAMIDSCNCSDSSDIELSDDWVGKKSPKISRGSKSPKLPR